MERNSILFQALEDALETIEQQKQDIQKYKDTIVDLIFNRRTALDAEIEVARWDLLRMLIKHHQELERGIDLGDNHDGYDYSDIYKQAYSTLTHNLTKLGIERIGELGEEVSVYHYYHESWSPHGAPAKVVSRGYYSSKADIVIQKALVIGEQDVAPWNKN